MNSRSISASWPRAMSVCSCDKEAPEGKSPLCTAKTYTNIPSRDVPVTDFGLNFGFPTTPLSGRGSRSKSKTPSRHLQRTSRGPSSTSTRNRISVSARSRRSASATSAGGPSISIQENDHQEESEAEPRPTKRRRTLAQKDSINDLYIAPDDVAAVKDEAGTIGDDESMGEVRAISFDGSNDKENHGPKQKRKKRKSIGQQSERNKRKRLSNELFTGSLPPKKRSALATTAHPSLQRHRLEIAGEETNAELSEDGEALNEDDTDDEEFQSAPSMTAAVDKTGKKKRKRKSITYETHLRKRSSQGSSRQSLTPPADLADKEVAVPPFSGKVNRKQIERTSRVSSTREQSSPPTLEEDNSEDDYVEDENSPGPRTPALEPKRTNKTKGDRVGRTNQSQKKGSFPILTQRLANHHELPTIGEAGESELDSEHERAREAERQSVYDRPQANTVDVLAQYCRETVEAAVDRLEVGTSNRAERQRKQTALESVGRELDDRLSEMSVAIENRIQLEGQVRRARRTRTELQARWAEVRRQKDAIALRCDRIRQQNWEREQEREAKWAISEAAHKVEVEVERAEEQKQESLEYLLRSVATEVSDNQGGGGLLDRVKLFNSTLARVAGVLEGHPM